MNGEPEFQRLQRAFTRHLRDPDHVPPPGAHEARRMAIYRHAIYANVAGFMADNYPRIRAVMGDDRWEAMLRDYIVRHVSRANAFVELPLEFLAYLEEERDDPADPPFLRELAHFDWLETLVGADPRRIDLDGVVTDGDLLAGCPVVNPTLQVVSYRYPVHAIDADFQPIEPPPRATTIAAFRAPDNLYNFLDLNAAAARLLEIVGDDCTITGRAALERIASELGHADLAGLVAAGSTILERMRARGALLGTRAAAAQA
ncbi:MAG: putative DNA-binding domain-containing protein [Gammaproteobacteria bacterium]